MNILQLSPVPKTWKGWREERQQTKLTGIVTAHEALTEKTNMATLKESAQTYVPKQTKNIAELEKVSIDLDLKEEKAKDGQTGEEFTYKYIEVNGEKYRIPGVVIGNIKRLLKEFPNMKHVRVLRDGVGKSTTYQVIPIQ